MLSSSIPPSISADGPAHPARSTAPEARVSAAARPWPPDVLAGTGREGSAPSSQARRQEGRTLDRSVGSRVGALTQASDFRWVAEVLTAGRDEILARWLDAAAAQPFHAGRRNAAVTDHMPALLDGLIAVLRRLATSRQSATPPLDDPAVLKAAHEHARTRLDEGLDAMEVLSEFRLLRQEITRCLRVHLTVKAPASDVLGAALIVNDALDSAALLALAARDEDEAQRRRLAEQLANEQARLAAVVENLPVGVIIAEAPSGAVVLANRQVDEILRHPPRPSRNVVDYELWHGLHPDGRPYRPEEWPLARAVQRGETVQNEEIDCLRGDGTRGTISASAAPIYDRQGQVVAGVVVFTDVTERKAQEQEREAFLAAVTHDLKNPLAAIKGVVQVLQREATRGPVSPAGLLARLVRIDQSAGRIATQLGELLDVARLRNGQPLELDLWPTDLVAIAHRVASTHQAATVGHTIRVRTAERVLMGEWDADRLERVLDNLLGNAVKFTPEGGPITLRLWREQGEKGEPAAAIRVSDRGIGIPKADLPHIFEWFRRASNATGRIAGTGIGLAASRQIVEQHGGTIDVESREGKGSTFTVRLPLGPPPVAPS